MPRRDRAPRAPFHSLGPLDTAIPISTGTARLTVETDGSVLLDVNGVPSSHLHPDPEHLVFEYMRWMLQVIDLHLEESGEERAAQLAHLGGGGCSLPRAVASRHPGARQIVVELDALLAERVREWFDLPRSPRLRLRVDDARTALEDWREDRFDVLVRDVFAGSVTPPELTGLAAVLDAARVLRPGASISSTAPHRPGRSCWPTRSRRSRRSSRTSASSPSRRI